MVEIIGATRYAEENTNFPPYAVPEQTLSNPSLPNNPPAGQIRTLMEEKNILKRAWAVVRGFCRGVSEKIRNALDLEFLE